MQSTPEREDPMNRSVLTHTLAAIVALGLAACSSDSSTGSTSDVTTAQEQADVGNAAAEVTGEALDVMYGSAGAATGTDLQLRAGDRDAAGWSFDSLCPYDQASGRHICPTATNGEGLTLDRSYEFLAGTTPQELFDIHTTTRIDFQHHLFGTITRQNGSATIDHRADVDVTPGQNGWNFQRVWNGSGATTLGALYDDGTISRTYQMNASTTLADVVVAVPRSPNPWPLSGTMTHVFTGTRTREGARTVSRTISYTATITFNGQSVVPVDVGTKMLCVNLATRRIVSVSCR